MRYIYVDEAGTSANEDVSVVVGVIVHADRQYLAAENELARLLDTVPEKYRTGFISHAKSIWGDKSLRDGWNEEDRKRFLLDMVSVPRRIGFPVTACYVRRKLFPSDPEKKLSLADYHHAMAFSLCLAQADTYIRERAEKNEIATVVAEDIPKNKDFLRGMVRKLQNSSLSFPDATRHGSGDTALSRAVPTEYRISRIKDAVHFLEKKDGPFLQIADACAFAFRRFLSNQSFGKELVNAMTDNDKKTPEMTVRLRTDTAVGSMTFAKVVEHGYSFEQPRYVVG